MRLIVSYCGKTIDVKQPLSQLKTFEHLLDCISLATGILYDAVICMAKDGVQVDQPVLDRLLREHTDHDVVRRLPNMSRSFSCLIAIC